ncbi:molybdenum cofactor guanylyltransferase MobA [Lampropedia cohaerens]|nr:molybdenum cofactor guanylyltransferase MobA [Lampropedia cohaerens]
MFTVQIQDQPILLTDARVPEQAPAELAQCGAVVRFVGRVRNDARGAALSHLVLEHFPGVTEAEIGRIVAQARQRWPLQAVRVVHRVGHIAVGEPIVLVETASAHRRDAYEANAFVMDYLKTEAPFWKQECFADGQAHWVEAKSSDQAAQQRWMVAPAGVAAGGRRIGALILAGGQGRRMGGRNKGLLPLDGLPLVQHVVRAIQPQVGYLAISANDALAQYQALGWPVFPDAQAWQGLGPLAGLASCAPHLPPHLDALLVVPCDTPRLPADLVARLAQTLFTPDAAPAVIAETADGPHPSVLLCRPAMLLGLLARAPVAHQSDLSIRGWLTQHGYERVFFEDAQAFINVNDPATLQRLQRA